VLPHQHQRVGQNIQSHSKAAPGHTHHELVLLQLFAPFVLYTHGFILNGALVASLRSG
jgi:hypothetical protein